MQNGTKRQTCARLQTTDEQLELKNPDCVLPTRGDDDLSLPSIFFTPQADHKHFLRVVLLDCVVTTDMNPSSVQAATFLDESSTLPIIIATVNTVSSLIRFSELLHSILVESRKISCRLRSTALPIRDPHLLDTAQRAQDGFHLLVCKTALPLSMLQSRTSFIAENMGEESAHDTENKNSTAEKVMMRTRSQKKIPHQNPHQNPCL